MADNETVLLEQFSTRADAEAFAELVRRHVRMVYSTSWRVLKDETDAADVTQETFFELTRHAGRISGSLGVWLHRVATRKSIDLIRRSTHRRRREHAYAQTQPEEVQTWHDLSGYVDEALDNLDESLRSMLLDHFLAGKTTVAIAQEQGLSQATVSRRINDGLEQLRGALRRQGLLVAAGALGVMLMENTSQAVPAAVLTQLSKMTMIGTTSTAVMAVHAGAVKAVIATAAIVATASVIGYIHHSSWSEPSAQPSVAAQPVQQSAGPSGNSRSYPASRATTTGEPQREPNQNRAAGPPETEQAETQESLLEPFGPSPDGRTVGGIFAGDPFSGVPTADLRTPQATVHSFLTLIDQGASDQLSECLAEGNEVAADGLYPRYLGQPIRLVDVAEEGDTAQVLWEATVHTPFSHKGKDRFPGEFVPLSSRLVRADGLWKLLKLDE